MHPTIHDRKGYPKGPGKGMIQVLYKRFKIDQCLKENLQRLTIEILAAFLEGGGEAHKESSSRKHNQKAPEDMSDCHNFVWQSKFGQMSITKNQAHEFSMITGDQICCKARIYLQRSVPIQPIQPNFSVTKWHAKRWHRPARSGQSLYAKKICLLSYFDMAFSCLKILYLYIFWFRARSFDHLFSLSWLVLAVSFHLRPGGVFNIGSGSR